MFEKNEIIIEEKKRFSESIMWGSQKSYYDEKGIDAWTTDVPNYITSNPFIGESYVRLVIAFIQDWIAKNPEAKNEPFYMLELGTGTGQFTYYFLKQFVKYQSLLGLEDIKFCYIMSDISTRPFSFWEEHVSLRPFFDSGVLDFALYDLYQCGNIELQRSAKTIDSKALKNPLIVIANYIFDSIATDVFTLSDGQLSESLATIKTQDKVLENGMPADWEKASIEYTDKILEETYYDNEFDNILFAYRGKLMDTHFQFPIAGLNAIAQLKSLSNDRLLLVTSDKGYTTLEELDCLDRPTLDYHGSFSVMVNYHAIGEFAKQNAGSQFIQAFRDNIVSGIFSLGFSYQELPQLRLALHQVIDGFSPSDYFLMFEHITNYYKKCSFSELASFLNMSNWDAYVFDKIGESITDLAEDGDPEVVAYLAANMQKVVDNVFYFPGSNDVIFDVGVFFQNINHFEEAIACYEKSNMIFGESDITYFNIGICYHSMNNSKAAIMALKKSLALNEEADDAKQWIDTIEREQEAN